MRVHRNPTVKVDANQSLPIVETNQNPPAVEADQNLITSVAETTGRVAAKVTNVLSALTGVVRRSRKR